ncbi:hypothetical protein D9M70_607850 [compost metagenome]
MRSGITKGFRAWKMSLPEKMPLGLSHSLNSGLVVTQGAISPLFREMPNLARKLVSGTSPIIMSEDIAEAL